MAAIAAVLAIMPALAYPLSMGPVGRLMLAGYLSQQAYRWIYWPIISTAYRLGCLDWLNSYLVLWE